MLSKCLFITFFCFSNYSSFLLSKFNFYMPENLLLTFQKSFIVMPLKIEKIASAVLQKGTKISSFYFGAVLLLWCSRIPTHLKNRKFRKRKLEMVKKSDDFEFGIDRQTLNLQGVRKKILV